MNVKNFKKDLEILVRFNSTQQQALANAPFGKEVNDCLLAFLEIAEGLGFKTINYDGYAGEVVFGEGEKDLGILCHLDIVPVGSFEDWNTPPFTLTEQDGKLIGRGVLDDKGPALIVLYALNALKEEGFVPNKKIRLILGCNEESGWECINHLKSLNKMPSLGFSPDADFPVIYAEKGIMHVEFCFECNNVEYLSGGKATNMVCDYVKCKTKIDQNLAKKHNLKINGEFLESHGKTAHASTPKKGENAMINVLKYLAEKNFVSQEILNKLFYNFTGILNLNDETGFLTLSPDLIIYEDNQIKILCDVRYPATLNYLAVVKEIEKIAPCTIKSHQPSLYVDKNSQLVQSLSKVYEKITKEPCSPIAIGGGTYARSMKNCVAFGPVSKEDECVCHEPNEFMKIDTIKLAYEIYKEALKTLE